MLGDTAREATAGGLLRHPDVAFRTTLVTTLVLATLVAACAPTRQDAVRLPPPLVESDRADDLACIKHPLVDAWEQRLRSRPETPRRLERAATDVVSLQPIFAEAGVPRTLAFLAVVDGRTSRRIGLVAGKTRGARLDRAAQAAARYLAVLHERYRDWPLALAAYETGVERVDDALAAEPAATFWALAEHDRLPGASREFVVRVLATARLATDARACGAGPGDASPAVAALSQLPPPPGRRGLSLRRQLTPQSALALSAGSGGRRDAPPDLRVTLGFQYTF